MIFSKQEIITKLKREICEIFFKKKDGSIRHMICTLNQSLIPTRELVRAEKASLPQTTPAKQNVIAVWDVEKMAWRSFRVNSLLFVDTESRERIEENVEEPEDD